jgi:hypothetical protein
MEHNQVGILRVVPWKVLFIIFGVVFIIGAAYYIASSQNFYRESGQDFFALWLAPHLLLQGKNPYLPIDWMSGSLAEGVKSVTDAAFLYPLPLAVLLVPLGFLPLEYAAIAWISLGILTIIFTSIVTLFMLKQNHWTVSLVIPIFIGIFLLRSVLETLRIGQLDWLILLFLTIGLYFGEKQKWLIAGILIAFSMIKPQIGLPFVLLISFWLIIRKKWSGLIGEVLQLIVLYFIGFLVNPSWLIQWLSIGSQKIGSTICCTPTLWGLSSLICSFELSSALKMGTIVVILVCLLQLVIFFQIPGDRADIAFGFSIPVSLLISPYLWTYSHIILLIPILIIVRTLKERHYPFLITGPFPLYMALLSGAIVFISMKIGVDVVTSVVPIITFIVLFFLNYKQLYRRRIDNLPDDNPGLIRNV